MGGNAFHFFTESDPPPFLRDSGIQCYIVKHGLYLILLAYIRTGRTKLLYVSAAFLLFAIKGFLMGSEIFFGEFPGVDIITSVLDFAILLAFFFGVIKR